jgi:hypothetical protein
VNEANEKLTERTADIVAGEAPKGIPIQHLHSMVDVTSFHSSLPNIGIQAPMLHEGSRLTTVMFAPPGWSKRDPLKPKKVAILGTAPSSRHMCPFTDLDWTIWGSSPGNAHGALPRVDAWFEMHSNLEWPEYSDYGKPYLKWLNEQPFPVVAQDEKLIPRGSIKYPLEEMLAEFGPYFFTSSFAWMMAYALMSGQVEEIALYGVDMASNEEYILQRPGGHYFMMLARNRGVKVTVPPESDLAQHPPLYGYEDTTPMGRKLAARSLELDNRVNQAQAQINQLQAQIHYLNGAREDIKYMRQIWGGWGVTPWLKGDAPNITPPVTGKKENG